MPVLKDEDLLAELEDIIRSQPPRATVRHSTEENFAWVGRAVAAIGHWDVQSGTQARAYAKLIRHNMAREAQDGIDGFMSLLYEARSSLRLATVGPVNVAIGHGLVFNYFDHLRQIIEVAQRDILFIDPYMDAEFVSRFLPYVRAAVSIRLLASRSLTALVPAAQLFAQQTKAIVEVRSSDKIHDRYVIIDGATCYQSGASFKDGAKNAGTVIGEITDAFDAVRQTYEDLWTEATKRL